MKIMCKDYLYSIQTEEIDNKIFYEQCIEIKNFLEFIFLMNGSDTQEFSKYGGITTANYFKHNILSFPNENCQKLYDIIRKNIKQFIPNKRHMVHCWLNVFDNNGGNIPWHSHWQTEFNAWHGYYCVNANNSTTSYKIKDSILIDVENKDGLLVFGKSGEDQHRSSEWFGDKPRITIAFDVIPLDKINNMYLSDLNAPMYVPI
jgi:hypothetical protein